MKRGNFFEEGRGYDSTGWGAITDGQVPESRTLPAFPSDLCGPQSAS